MASALFPACSALLPAIWRAKSPPYFSITINGIFHGDKLLLDNRRLWCRNNELAASLPVGL